MEELISQMSEFENLQSILKSWCIENQLEQPKSLSYSLEKIQKLYRFFIDKYGRQQNFIVNHEDSTEPIWVENELILFQWTVIALSLTYQIYLTDFKKSQIDFLSTIFRNKENYIIEYQIKCMMVKGKQIRNAWKVQEEEILSKVIQKASDKNKWNQIARQLYKNSQGKYFRQGKHCRQRWFVHIQKRKPGKSWNLEADIELLQLIKSMGKKWSQIANKFTKPESRLSLKKRFRILLEEAQARFGDDITQKEVISLLLQIKYEKASSSKIKAQSKKGKRLFTPTENKNSTRVLEKSLYEKENSQKSDEQWQLSKKSGLKCEDISQNKINLIIENQMGGEKDQKRIEQDQLLFNPEIQITQNFSCMGYFPIQYYPQICPLMGQIGLEWVSYGPCIPPYHFGGQFLFYL